MRFNFAYLVIIIILYFFIQISFFSASLTESQEIALEKPVVTQPKPQTPAPQTCKTKDFINYFLSNNNPPEPYQCDFPSPQFSNSEIEEVFKYQNYSKCKTVTQADIKIFNNSVSAVCKNLATPSFIHDLTGRQVIGGKYKIKPVWVKSKEIHENGEFVIVKCGQNSIYSVFFNRFKPEVERKANEIRNKLKGDQKNFNVILLLFDQVSKYSVYRNWPEVMSFFRELKENPEFNNSFSLYEFDKPTVIRPMTIYNMAPILYGLTIEQIKWIIGFGKLDRYKPSEHFINLQNKSAIWRHYNSLGYTSMVLSDTVYDYIPQITGRDILADHTFLNFWKLAWAVYRWNDFSNSQRCLGDKNSHAASMDYLYQYLNNYKNNHKFAYVHLDAAHESSGNVKTIDHDLVHFLKRFLSLMQSKGENFVFFLLGDHGIKRLYTAQWDIRSYYESNIPMTYLLMSKEVEDKWNLKELLDYNTKQLLGRFDINLSLKDISYFPYGDLKQTFYEKLKSLYKLSDVTSIFSEKLDPKRTCKTLGVSNEYCLCTRLDSLDLDNVGYQFLNENIIELVKEYFEVQAEKNPHCKKFERFKVDKFEYFMMKANNDGQDTLLYSEFILENEVRVKVISNFCDQKKIEMTGQILPEDTNPYKYFTLSSKIYFIQISSVEVLNSLCSQTCIC